MRRLVRAATRRAQTLVRRRQVLRNYHSHAVRISDVHRGTVSSWPIEDYVVGAVAAETDEHWPEAALMAQAVACRTYALRRLVHPRGQDFDVTGSVTDQCFVIPTLASERVRGCVELTSGEVLVESGGRFAPNRPHHGAFHIACGGATDEPSAVWGADEATTVVAPCDACAEAAPRWRAEVSVHQLRSAAGLATAGGPVVIEVTGRTPAGRVRIVEIRDGAHARSISAEQLRSIVGFTALPSTRFSILEPVSDTMGITVAGTGHGHGVGLCMLGAQALAREGADHRSILAHYYPGAGVHRLVSG